MTATPRVWYAGYEIDLRPGLEHLSTKFFASARKIEQRQKILGATEGNDD